MTTMLLIIIIAVDMVERRRVMGGIFIIIAEKEERRRWRCNARRTRSRKRTASTRWRRKPRREVVNLRLLFQLRRRAGVVLRVKRRVSGALATWPARRAAGKVFKEEEGRRRAL